MNTTPQERMALGVIALLVSAGVGARMLRHTPAPATLAGADAAADARSLDSLTTAVREGTDEAARRSRPLAPDERLDPNAATAEELDRLPRVGPAQAARIVAWREAHGPFRTLGDLDAVPGIGAGAVAALAPHLALPAGPPSAPAAAATPPAASAEPAPPPPPPWAAGTATPPSPRGRRTGARGASSGTSPGRVVNVNSASAEELQTLPGIGPALAARIVDWRGRNGRFGGADDLAKVRGIGPATVTRLRPRITTTP